MPTGVYTHGKFLIGRGAITLDTADIRVLLVNSGYVFSAAHAFVSDIVFEIGGVGYSRKPLLNKVLIENDITSRITFDADNVTWTTASFSGSGLGDGTPDSAIIYVEGSSDALRPLICCVDVSPKLLPVANDYILQFPLTGILAL